MCVLLCRLHSASSCTVSCRTVGTLLPLSLSLLRLIVRACAYCTVRAPVWSYGTVETLPESLHLANAIFNRISKSTNLPAEAKDILNIYAAVTRCMPVHCIPRCATWQLLTCAEPLLCFPLRAEHLGLQTSRTNAFTAVYSVLRQHSQGNETASISNLHPNQNSFRAVTLINI